MKAGSAMVALACNLFLTIQVQQILLLCAPLALVTEIIQAFTCFNSQVLPSAVISAESVLSSPKNREFFPTDLIIICSRHI